MHKTISHILLTLTSVMVLFSCSVREELLKVQEDIDGLRVQIGEMNSSIVALQDILTEIWKGGLLTSVKDDVIDGVECYIMEFLDGRTITIRQGVDGHSPKIGVALDEKGEWCWILDGEWLLDGDGNKIPATAVNGVDGLDGITPQLKIVEEYWYISMDNGVSWTRLGRAQGKDAVEVFTGIDTSSEAYVEVFLAAGGSIKIPRYIPLTLNLDVPEEDTGLYPGETREFHYNLSGRLTDETVVTAGTDGKYTLNVKKLSNTEGVIYVTCPQVFQEGFVYLLVNDGEGHSVVKVINFYERVFKVSSDFTFWVDCNGGLIDIPLQYNFDFTLESDCDWLIPVQTKAEMKTGQIAITVLPNTTDQVRKGHVIVHPADHPDFVVETFTIEEASAYFYISQTSITVESAGRDFGIYIESSRGVTIQSTASWVHCRLSDNGNYSYNLNLSIDRNTSTNSRSTTIYVLTGDGSTVMGNISVTQLPHTEDHTKDFVFTARAAKVYDYTIYLPVYDWLDCAVDWGDGNVEAIRKSVSSNQRISHKYAVSEPATYTITISGQANSMSTSNMPAADVILTIEQWGNLNVHNFDNCLSGCVRLTSVPEDKLGFFANANYCYNMFYNCRALETVPEGLFTYAERIYSLSSAFSNSGITNVPEKLFSGMKALKDINSMFSNCKNLKSIPEELFTNCPNAANITNFNNLFSDSGLESIPEYIFRACTSATSYYRTFSNTPIKTIPAKLFSKSKMASNFGYTFESCNKLEVIPVSLFDENRRITQINGIFSWSYPNLKKTESPYTIIDGKKVHLYERANYPDDFVEPTSHGNALRAFANHQNEWGIETIPSDWR